MVKLDRGSLTILVLLFVSIVVSATVLFTRYVVLHDYEIITDPDEAPEIDSANPEVEELPAESEE